MERTLMSRGIPEDWTPPAGPDRPAAHRGLGPVGQFVSKVVAAMVMLWLACVVVAVLAMAVRFGWDLGGGYVR